MFSASKSRRSNVWGFMVLAAIVLALLFIVLAMSPNVPGTVPIEVPETNSEPLAPITE